MRAKCRQEERCRRGTITLCSEEKFRFVRIEVSETRFRIRETNPCSSWLFVSNAVANEQFKPFGRTPRHNFDPAILAGSCDSVADGVLYQGLKDQLRHEHGERFRINGPSHGKPGSETHLFEIKIFTDELQLFLQWDQIRTAVLQRRAQKAGEPHDHFLCARSVTVDER